ncbi:chorismate mutase [Streptomyces sp. HNM0574]|nr:chorismate mutase [Streptomyces sp. HNM0574]NLU67476.1 chorismate mutase [Streptomyces sp. HNM0574]
MPAPAQARAPAAATAERPGLPPLTERTRLAGLAELAAERLETADKVAAAKWGAGKPVDDPARERQILDDVARRSAATGVDPDEATAVFRDQIEANKLVQRGLHARWERHPAERPAQRPDLAKEVRPVLDRITGELLDALRDSEAARHSGPGCAPRLAADTARAAHARHFDPLHTRGLARAVPSFCAN